MNIITIITLLAIGVGIGLLVMFLLNKFSKMSDDDKIRLIQNWLLGAVILAEKQLGSGTGEAKLALVFQWFSEKFPAIAMLMTEEQFNEYVKEALKRMRKMMENNEAINNYLVGLQLSGEDQDLR